MTSDIPTPDKTSVRTTARTARRALDADRRREASDAISRRFLDLPETIRASTVLAYSALPEEADPAPAVAVLRDRGVRVALPKVSGAGSLSLHWTDSDSDLVPGPFGIREPTAGQEPAAAADLDLVIVPGVAFDASCRRIGFGGGYYDALLPTLPASTRTVAFAFDEQIVDEVPCEAHDARVDVVVTPTTVYRRPL